MYYYKYYGFEALTTTSTSSVCVNLTDEDECKANPDCLKSLTPFPKLPVLTADFYPIDDIITIDDEVDSNIFNTEQTANITSFTTDFDIRNVLLFDENSPKPFCFRHKTTKQVYEFQATIDLPDDYESFIITNDTCQTLRCEEKGMMCGNSVNYLSCEYYSFYCCSSFNECVALPAPNHDSEAPFQDHVAPCQLPCAKGFTCRLFGNQPTCFPTTCEYLTCDSSNECVLLKDIGIAGCQLKPDYSNILESCRDEECPPNFHCGKGMLTDYDCIPNSREMRDVTQPRVCTTLNFATYFQEKWDNFDYSPFSEDYFQDNVTYTVN
ncbi:hypothetical protein PPL_06598 [Heterostelium album PN500]|uniref:DSCP-N domain-containing protein n=1 Tax=Heterostelium pallidum (strain ATCC 26659 / Pp 5 / PN500) TaxID=670386 RepID=D3BF65_HETP5|nr:hypothetical protein PPL_06598 [Heterostelium album PN500]EFA79779.1 hypothetical protein PPL_06598 [Heterostelium album PN500]|eukprot:XP_020431900.1 hypothetical protein PPL_06598 [Heterostelium album PN500]